MKISILTLFPQMFQGPFDCSIVKNAINKKKVEINFINIRDFGIGFHKTVDDKPYGGGTGMILRADVLGKAIEKAKKNGVNSGGRQKTVLLDPVGKTFNQEMAKSFSKLTHLILICGHYEGVDARIRNFVDEIVSIGDFITTGGEIPAMIITDSVVRLLGGVLKKDAVEEESFLKKEKKVYLEYPQYTRPDVYKKNKVPKILLSGDHKKIEIWRQKQSVKITRKNRIDLV